MKNIRQYENTESGNILVTALIMLVVMTLLSVAIFKFALRQSNTTNNKSIDSELFYITQTCFQDSRNWFRTQTRTPTLSSIPQFSRNNLTGLFIDTNSTKVTSKLSKNNYSCTVGYITSLSKTENSAGEEIGNKGGEYNGSAAMDLEDYYQINATGTGPSNSVKQINTIISVYF